MDVILVTAHYRGVPPIRIVTHHAPLRSRGEDYLPLALILTTHEDGRIEIQIDPPPVAVPVPDAVDIETVDDADPDRVITARYGLRAAPSGRSRLMLTPSR